MYKKKRIISVGSAVGLFNPFCKDVRIARPMSYYAQGGVDLNGVSERPPLPPVFDGVEDVASGDINVATDARIGKLDIIDMVSEIATETAARSASQVTGEHVENNDE